MNSEQLLLDKWRVLTADEQQEVLDFVDLIAQKLDRSKQARSTDFKIIALRVKRWIDWVQSHAQDSPGLPDKALRRDSIYED